VHVWSLASGKRTISRIVGGERRPTGGEDRAVGYIALAGEPCSAIVGTDAYEASKPTSLEAYSCETGSLLATVPATQLPKGLLSLTPVQGCGLVIASYSGGSVAVYDTAKRSLRPDLAKLFSGLTPKAKASAKRYYENARWVLAAPSPKDCLIKGVLLKYSAVAEQLVPAGLYEFDLRAGQARLLGQLPDDRHVDAKRIMPLARLMTSPSGNTVALLFQRVTDIVFQNKGPLGTADLIVFDLKTGLPRKVVDMRGQGSATRGIALLNDREIILNTWMMDVGNVVSLFDLESEKSHTLCNSDFTSWKRTDRGDEGPAAIGVDAARSVLAVVYEQTVRVYRYRRDPALGYAGRQLCNN
jgi:hypothetical protein